MVDVALLMKRLLGATVGVFWSVMAAAQTPTPSIYTYDDCVARAKLLIPRKPGTPDDLFKAANDALLPYTTGNPATPETEQTPFTARVEAACAVIQAYAHATPTVVATPTATLVPTCCIPTFTPVFTMTPTRTPTRTPDVDSHTYPDENPDENAYDVLRR